MANEPGTAHRVTAGHLGLAECRVWESLIGSRTASLAYTSARPLRLQYTSINTLFTRYTPSGWKSKVKNHVIV